MNKDGLGNINKTVDRTYDVVNNKNFYKTTYNTYGAEDKTKWHIGRLTNAKVVHTQTDGSSVTRSSTFKYNSNGVLSEEVANAGTSVALKKTYAYDSKGNKVKETVSGYGLTTASTTYGYSSDGKFQTSVTNAAGLKETRTYNPKFGTIASLTGPNGLKTTWQYDGLGRKTKETRADGTWSSWGHYWYKDGTLNQRYVYRVTQTQSGVSGNISTYYDSLGRETSKHHSSLGGKRILQYKYYNAKGELYQESLPYIYKDESAKYARTYYDKYGRTTKVTKPGPAGSTQTYTTSYNNFTQITTDANGNKKRTIKNAIDQTIQVTDAYGSGIDSNIWYTYDASGNLLTTKDSGNNVITMKYDVAGNKTYLNDPDMGVWNYTYNAAGKLYDQWSGIGGKDASKNFTYKRYDVLGRVTSTNTYNRVEYLSNKSAYTYNYQRFTYGTSDAAVGARGKLIQSYASSKTKKTDWTHETRTMTYDSKGRPTKVNNYIYKRGNYITSTSYDAYSRPSVVTYPNGYKLTHSYDSASGILKQVKGTDTKGKVTNHYTVNAMSAFGQTSRATFGNGIVGTVGYDSAGFIGGITSFGTMGNIQELAYTYDAMGNVKTRDDQNIEGYQLKETFKYDAMNRMTRYDVSTDITKEAFANSRTYTYDRLGNIKSKSGYGTYTYHTDKPHAVKSVGSRTYAYDEVGNMTNRNGDTIYYNPNNKATILTNGKNGKEVRFYYGVGGKRYMKKTADKQTFYLGKAYEEEQATGSNEVKSTIYISVGGKTVGTHVEVLDSNYISTNAKHKTAYNHYFHTDALGSITAITNDSGNVIERRSYEPFGKIRAMDYGLTSKNDIIPANTVKETTRAFTGHEQIAEISGLIHMNARLYDSDIGRFTSADTFIQAPHNTQSYNRYSYVLNNPLVYTDPTGHFFKKLFKWIKKNIATIVAVVVAVVVAIYAPQLLVQTFSSGSWGSVTFSAFGTTTAVGTTLTTLGGAAVGAIAGFSAGFFGSLAGGASFGDAVELGMKAAFAGAITGGIGAHYGNTWNLERVAMHGLGGGTGSEVMGGSFKDGFKMAAALALVTWGAMEMREHQIASSKKYVDINGDTPNYNPKTGAIAGGRVYDNQTLADAIKEDPFIPLGGVQGSEVGNVFGFEYHKNSLFSKMIMEPFAGPHDFWRDMLGMYNANGNSIPSSGFLYDVWDWGNNFAGVFAVSPIVGASMAQPYDYLITLHRNR